MVYKPAPLLLCSKYLDPNYKMDVQKTKDNPLWPNTSSVARAKDAAAKLPLPKVKQKAH